MAKEARKPGRPIGAKTQPPAIVDSVPAACPHLGCGCTERAAVAIVREREIGGMAPNGQERTHIVWRRVRCKGCERLYTIKEHQRRAA